MKQCSRHCTWYIISMQYTKYWIKNMTKDHFVSQIFQRYQKMSKHLISYTLSPNFLEFHIYATRGYNSAHTILCEPLSFWNRVEYGFQHIFLHQILACYMRYRVSGIWSHTIILKIQCCVSICNILNIGMFWKDTQRLGHKPIFVPKYIILFSGYHFLFVSSF